LRLLRAGMPISAESFAAERTEADGVGEPAHFRRSA
jgi:hypothetical protein